MKKFALMLVVFAFILGSFSVAAAQDTNTNNQQGQGNNTQGEFEATVSWDGTNLSVSPETLPLNQPVRFAANFQGQANNQGNASDFAGYHLVLFKLNDGSTTDGTVWQFNGAPAVFRSASDNMTVTFDEAGTYALALFEANQTGQDNSQTDQYVFADAADTAQFTVSESASTTSQGTQSSTQAQSGTSSQDQSATTGQSAQTQDQGPQNLPTTGGESAPWLTIVLVLGALLLLGGGALLLTRPDRSM